MPVQSIYQTSDEADLIMKYLSWLKGAEYPSDTNMKIYFLREDEAYFLGTE